jgi:hypothetical protein
MLVVSCQLLWLPQQVQCWFGPELLALLLLEVLLQL